MQALSALRSAFGGMSIRDCSRSALELEVVEVKNACPYRQVTTISKKGRAKLSYTLTDGGPHNRVCSLALTACCLKGHSVQKSCGSLASTRGLRPVLGAGVYKELSLCHTDLRLPLNSEILPLEPLFLLLAVCSPQ